MGGPPYRRWMCKRFLPGRKGYRQEFFGVDLFDQIARSQMEYFMLFYVYLLQQFGIMKTL